MTIFIFVYQIVFDRSMPNYSTFVLMGWIVWRWISGSITQCTYSISSRTGILEQISAPKHIFPMVSLLVETLLFTAALTMIPLAMMFDGTAFTWHIIEFIPVTIVTFITLYGFGLIMSHIGTIVADFKQVITYVLRLLFYLSPIFYEIQILPDYILPYYHLNPVSVIVESYRACFIYGQSPDYFWLGYVLLLGIILIPLGLYLTKKYDKTYAKIK